MRKGQIMEKKLKAQNILEQALIDRNPKLLIQAIAEEACLLDSKLAFCLEDECFSDTAALSALILGTSAKQLKELHASPGNGPRVKQLLKEALTPPSEKASDDEKQLIQAVLRKDNDTVITLVRGRNIRLYGVSRRVLQALPDLSKRGAFTLLSGGLSPKVQAVVLGIFVRELTEEADLTEKWSYEERLRYTNLLIHILSGEDVDADTPWYPEKQPQPFFYYLDPEHRYNPYESGETTP